MSGETREKQTTPSNRLRPEHVQLHSRYYGKGPTKAKTHLVTTR